MKFGVYNSLGILCITTQPDGGSRPAIFDTDWEADAFADAMEIRNRKYFQDSKNEYTVRVIEASSE